ncbi:MAG: tyrosine-protein phosphatase [Acidimicrobiales bacterium]
MTTLPAPGQRIDLEGALNLRDLGGWPTLDGSAIRRGVAFRCDRLSQLTDSDHEIFAELGIVTVIDFRYPVEVAEDPSRLWSGVANHIEIPMAGKLAQEKSFLERAFDGEMEGINDDWVFQTYVDMLEAHADGFATAIRHVANDGPSLFHCTAGKDRTGIMAMLLLSIANVDRERILDDFELSNPYRAEPRMAALAPIFAERGLDVEDFRPALGAPRPAMAKTLTWLDETHGGPLGYLRSEAGLTDAELGAVRSLLVAD